VALARAGGTGDDRPMGQPAGSTGGRGPFWSGPLTSPLAGMIPAERRGAALATIKAIHTAIFVSVAATVLVALLDGLRGRPRRRTAVAGAVVVAESALYVSNNQVCPLTPLAEQLGASRGSVVDLFLPARVARQIPLVAGSASILALVLNVRAWRSGASHSVG